jgi:hypothetical protein
MTEITPRAGEQLSRTYLALAIAGAAALLYLRTFLLSATPVIAHDDQTIFFARAVNFLHGQILYRDFFEFVPPGALTCSTLQASASSVFMPKLLQSWSIALGLAPFCLVTQLASRFFVARSSCFQGFSFSSSISLPQWSRPTTGIAPSPHLPRSAHFPAD